MFLTRLFLAIVFYICISLADKHSIIAGMVLVAGYRAFLAFSPLISKRFGSKDILFSILLAILGVITYYYFNFYIIGAVLIAFGLSISGFIIKSIAAESPSTAGWNKVAITSGNIGAGVILLSTNNNDNLSYNLAILLLILACFIKINTSQERPKIATLNLKNIIQNRNSYIIWLLFGIAIGIRVFGMYIIMPHYLIQTLGSIPKWYGAVFIVYGVTVILMQFHAISKKYTISLQIAIMALALSCIVMVLPSLFKIETMIGAFIWCTCLALEEIFAPYIDFHAARSNNLLIKELAIGLGGAICVLITQTFNHIEYLGLFAILCIIIGNIVYARLSNK